MNTEQQDYYLAGLFDGEGSVSVMLAKQSYMAVCVKVAMCDRAPVAMLFERFGGFFCDGKQKTKKTGRPVYAWSVYNADALEALQLFSTRCTVKNTVAAAALPLAQSMRDNPTRGVLSQVEKQARLEAAALIARTNKPVGNHLIFDAAAVAEYMRPKTRGGSKRVRFGDGREFSSSGAAAQALGVTRSAVGYAVRGKRPVRGMRVEFV